MGRKAITLVLFFAVLPAAHAQQKKRVAVMNFDYATVQSSVAAIFGSNQDIGKGIADLLVDKLVSDGVFSVIERKALDKILAEQNFSNSDRADPSSAAKIGKVLGVDAIIIGSVTQFGRDDRATGVGGAALGGITGRFGIGGVQKKESKAVVGVTARLINTSTAEILASVSGTGQSRRSGTALLGTGGNSSNLGGGNVDMASSNFGNTLLGEATHDAVTNVAGQLDQKAALLPTVAIQISGLVADAAPDGAIIVNVGSKDGVKVGDKLDIKRKAREVRDPATQKVIRTIEDPVGQIVITEVDEQSAVGKFTGPGTPKVGDTVSTAK